MKRLLAVMFVFGSALAQPLQNRVMIATSSDGRMMTELRSGADGVRRLAPGVYFVRHASSAERSAAGVTNVVVAR